MQEKIKIKAIKLEERFSEIEKDIEKKMNENNYKNNNSDFKTLMKEFKKLRPVAAKFREYKTEIKNLEELEILFKESHEKEMKELVNEEIKQVKVSILNKEQEIKKMLISNDPNDHKNVIIEIRGGAGGQESALFSAVILKMYSMYSQKKGFKFEVTSFHETELGGFKEIFIMVTGNGAYSKFKYESGVHRVQRVPETENSGRVHTSTVTVAVLPEAEDVDVEINPTDLKFDTFRSSGAGGQHVNTTDSAVRITHIPTNTVVECQDERSQHKNKDKAMKILKSRILQKKREEQKDDFDIQRRFQVGTGDRSERIRTYNYAQNRITDHRINFTSYRLEEMLNGDIDEMIDALSAVFNDI